MKKMMLILLLTVGMTLSFAAIALVMLFALNVVESLEEARDLLTGQVPGAISDFKEGELEVVQDALLLLQQHKKEIEQDFEKLKEEHKKLEQDKMNLKDEIGELETQGQDGDQNAAQARAQRLEETIALYSAMRPADAAAILNGLPDEMILEILPRLPERQAGRILSGLDDETKKRLAPLLIEGKTAQR